MRATVVRALLRVSPPALAPALALALAAVACQPTNQGYAPDQPIAYSHAVHAGAMRIPCGYCHYGAERGRYAGIPPASVCMNCHSKVATDLPEVAKIREAIEKDEPIRWNRVHFIPDHAYFSHAPHVNAGLACQDCHGPIENMGRVEQWAPLTMGWCVDCHRTSGAGERLAGTAEAAVLTDCATCHH